MGSMVRAMAKMRVPMPYLAMPDLPMPKVADVQTAKQ
jgi:hypothetical protein